MKPKIAVFGAGSIGCTIAADLTLAGYEINLLELPKFKQRIAGVQRLGGIHLSGDMHALISGKTGFAKPNMVTTAVKEALEDVDVIFVDVPATEYEDRFDAIAPYLKNGQIVNFNTYGYWASLRVASILKQRGKENVILSESPAPIHMVRGRDGSFTSVLIRERVPLAVFPSKKSKEVFDVLKAIFPTYEMAKDVLQTNFNNINMTVHPGIALLNIGSFDRAEERNEKFNFYVTGNTVHTGILEESYDRERIPVCQAYGVIYTSLKESIIRYYGSKGKTVYEVIRNCKPYQGLLKGTSGWVIGLDYLMDQLGRSDIPFSLVPFVSLASLAGVSTPITRAIIDIFGAIFETDFWKTGLTLHKLGLAGLTTEGVIRYITEGEAK